MSKTSKAGLTVVREADEQGPAALLAAEASTAIRAVEMLRSGEEFPQEQLREALRRARRLRDHLRAVEDELTLYARESPAGATRARLSWRGIADELGVHFTTVRERRAQLADGEHSEWRPWLVQGTPRASMYGGTADSWAQPQLLTDGREHETMVTPAPNTGRVQARCSCGWTGAEESEVTAATKEGDRHEAEAAG